MLPKMGGFSNFTVCYCKIQMFILSCVSFFFFFLFRAGTKVEGILRQSADVEEVDRRVQEYEQGMVPSNLYKLFRKSFRIL